MEEREKREREREGERGKEVRKTVTLIKRKRAQQLKIMKSKPLVHLSPVFKLCESKQGNLYVCGRVH